MNRDTDAWESGDASPVDALDADVDVDDDLIDDELDKDATRSFDTMLFDGDQGTLPLNARKALVAVMKNSYIAAQHDPNTWAVMLAHRADIESVLNNMFLMLVVDKTAGIAFKQQAPGDRFTTLLPPDISWGLDDTILLRHLREIFSVERGLSGDSVFVDREPLIERVVADVPASQTDLTLATRRAEKAFDNIRAARILLRTTDADRWQISPVIVPLLPLEKLNELKRWLASASESDTAENDLDGGQSSASDTASS
jgi:hypothetical protein